MWVLASERTIYVIVYKVCVCVLCSQNCMLLCVSWLTRAHARKAEMGVEGCGGSVIVIVLLGKGCGRVGLRS